MDENYIIEKYLDLDDSWIRSCIDRSKLFEVSLADSILHLNLALTFYLTQRKNKAGSSGRH